MRIVIVTIRVASAINTSVYVNISANVTIAAPEEVDNLAALTGFAYLIICFRFLSISAARMGRLFHSLFLGQV